MMRSLLTATVCAALATSAFGATAPEVLRKASDHRHWNKHAESLKFCEELLAHPEADENHKVEALAIMIDVARRKRSDEDVEHSTARLLKEYPENAKALYYVYVHRGDNHRDRNRLALSMASYRDLAAADGIDGDTRALAYGRIAELLLRLKRYPEALKESALGSALEMRDDGRKAWVLWMEIESAWRAARFDACASAVERMLEPKYLRRRNANEHPEFYWRYAESKRLAGTWSANEAREYLRKKVREVKDPKLSQGLELRIARSFYDEGAYVGALAAYERVFTEHADVTEYWYEAQRGLVESLMKLGRPKDALSEARICLDDGEGWLPRNVRLVAEVLRATDGKVDRANAFLDYQRYGTRGADGKPDTKDDLSDPLRDVPYAAHPEREKVFARARAEAGDSAWSSYNRAMTYLYTGKKTDALRHFVDCFRRCTFNNFQRFGDELVYRGLRPVVGHGWNLESAYHYVAYGPAGKDGKTGTKDDRADPFPSAIAGVGELHTPEQRAALERVRDFMKSSIVDGTFPGHDRFEVVYSLERVMEAIGRHDAGIDQDWILSHAANTGDERFQEAMVGLGLNCAKGDVLHFGKARAFLGVFATALKAAHRGITGRANWKQQHYWNMMARIANKWNIAPREHHMKMEQGRREAFGPRDLPVAPERTDADTTPPGVPGEFARKNVGYTWVEVSWAAAEEPESGVDLYEVYRDGSRIARTKELVYRESELGEGEAHEYRVRALSAIGLYSPLSAPLRLTTEIDRTAPTIVEIVAAGSKERIVVLFDERVNAEDAARASNFTLEPGVNVTKAELDDEGLSVTLTTTPLIPDAKFTVVVGRIRDRAKTPNTAVSLKKEFVFEDIGNGLKAVYYDDPNFKGKTLERLDPVIDFDYNGRDPAPGIARVDFTVRWTGKVRVDTSGTYTFIARTDDGVRLWVNKKLIVDAWIHRGASDSHGNIELKAGVLYDIKMEYFQGGGGASAQLFWQSKSIKRQIVPSKHLYAH